MGAGAEIIRESPFVLADDSRVEALSPRAAPGKGDESRREHHPLPRDRAVHGGDGPQTALCCAEAFQSSGVRTFASSQGFLKTRVSEKLQESTSAVRTSPRTRERCRSRALSLDQPDPETLPGSTSVHVGQRQLSILPPESHTINRWRPKALSLPSPLSPSAQDPEAASRLRHLRFQACARGSVATSELQDVHSGFIQSPKA